MKTVRKAVIPAAGLGTRVLPASKAMPKEMLPIVDKPAIQFIVEEAVRAGITDILIITNRGKSIMEDHFDRAPELEERLLASGKKEVYDEVVNLAHLANIVGIWIIFILQAQIFNSYNFIICQVFNGRITFLIDQRHARPTASLELKSHIGFLSGL